MSSATPEAVTATITQLRGEKRVLQDRVKAAEMESIHLRRKLEQAMKRIQHLASKKRRRKPRTPTPRAVTAGAPPAVVDAAPAGPPDAPLAVDAALVAAAPIAAGAGGVDPGPPAEPISIVNSPPVASG